MKFFALLFVLSVSLAQASPGGFLTDIEKNCSLSFNQYDIPGSSEKLIKHYGLCKWSHSVEQTEFLCATKNGKVPSAKDCMKDSLKVSNSGMGDTVKAMALHKEMEAAKIKDCTAGVNDTESTELDDGNLSDGSGKVFQYPLGNAGKK